MLKLAHVAVCVVAVSVVSVAVAEDRQKTPGASATVEAARQEIRAAANSFLKSFRQRDADAVAAHWTADGVYTNEVGERFEGRQAIQVEYEALFKNAPEDLGMQLEIDSVRLISPQTAIEEGRVALTPQAPGAVRVMSRYTAVHVKQDGKWLMSDLRDTRVEVPPATGQLEDLDWMVGVWSATREDVKVEVKCRWIQNRHFLERTHTASKSGKVTSQGVEIIGLDPSTGRITSWSFTSDGGHAVGIWAPQENGWIIETVGVMSDGTSTYATNILSRQDKDHDTLAWKSVNRTAGDTLLPDTDAVALKRN